MSAWMHVAAVFRIDGIRDRKGGMRDRWDEVTGRTIHDGDWITEDSYERRRMEEDWKEYDKHPDRFVPTGSEGSLQRLVWVNPNSSCMARYTVTVFGDLRDYESFDRVKEWFHETCRKCYVRQAVCNCVADGVGVKTWTVEWDSESEKANE